MAHFQPRTPAGLFLATVKFHFRAAAARAVRRRASPAAVRTSEPILFPDRPLATTAPNRRSGNASRASAFMTGVGRWRFCCFCHPSRLPSRTASGRRTHALPFRSRCPMPSRRLPAWRKHRVDRREPGAAALIRQQAKTIDDVVDALRDARRDMAIEAMAIEEMAERLAHLHAAEGCIAVSSERSWNKARCDPLQPHGSLCTR
jgi:hypothetical protein